MESVSSEGSQRQSAWSYWHQTPLYLRIVIALGIGIVLGLLLGEHAGALELISKIILRLLGALAPPLILIAVVHVLMTSEIPGKSAGKLAFLLILNTVVAILIGLTVANVLQPGKWASTPVDETANVEAAATAPATGPKKPDPIELLVDNIPRSLLGPLGDKQNVIGVIFIAVAFGIALRRSRDKPLRTTRDLVEIAYEALIIVLHWIIDLVPIGVLCIVASVVGTQGFAPFKAMGAFIITVLIALFLQAVWYMVRIHFFSWANPFQVLRGMRDALVMAFSTDSSTATMPVTYACLKEKVGLRERSASLGGLVGANFNNDGTALYEATAALFIAQLIGVDLSIQQQLMVILTSIVASVGAAGIPEAGLVTMTLVFTAVGLPVEKIALLLTVDWFLDRCRTTINVLGDVNVSCILDGMTPKSEDPLEQSNDSNENRILAD